jgi:hypothetical protein
MSQSAQAIGQPRPLEGIAERLRERAWIAAWWAGSRALVIATALVVDVVGPRGWLKHDERVDLFGVLNAWDGKWYRMIAADGYLLVPGRQSDPAFFPLFPLLLRGAHELGIGYYAAGLLIGNLGLLVALVAFEALTRELMGPGIARRATIYVAIFPLGYVFSMSYPQSIVVAAIALAALAAARGRWLLAGACAAAAALARPEGLFVALPIAAYAYRRWRAASPVERGLALGAVAAPAAAIVSYPIYLGGVLHDTLAWTRAQQGWGRHFSPFGFVHAGAHLPDTLAHNPWLVRDVVALGVYVVLLAAAWRAGTPRAWLLAGAAVVVLPLFSGSFDSLGRFGLLALPVFWGLAWLGRTRRADLAIRCAAITLLVGATVTIPYVFP